MRLVVDDKEIPRARQAAQHLAHIGFVALGAARHQNPHTGVEFGPPS